MTAWNSLNGNKQYLVPPPAPMLYSSAIPSGSVGLYPDASWTGTPFWIRTSAYTEKVQASFSGTSSQDSCTWVAFNLPVGTVMTLLKSATAPLANQPYNFVDAGVCVDLIGNGSIQTVDLTQIDANDCLSALIWRRVDLEAGIFQLFDHEDCAGSGNTFFLDEWPVNKVNSLPGWDMSDKAASIYFGGLGVRAVTLYDGAQGDGQSAQFAGWLRGVEGPHGMGANLVGRGFNDKAASWDWSLLTPVYQTVEPFSINSTLSVDESLSVTLNSSGENEGASTVQQIAKFIYTISQAATLTVTSTSTYGYTQTTGFKFSVTLGAGTIASATWEAQLNIGFSQEFTDTATETVTTTQTLASEVNQLLSVPANSSWRATLTLQYAKVPPTRFETTARYFYEEEVPGSVSDPVTAAQLDYPALYVVSVPVFGFVDASLSVNAVSKVTTKPIGSWALNTTTSTIDPTPVPVLPVD
jgi:hypothetical protein